MRTIYASISPVDKETAAFVMRCQYAPHAQASVAVVPHPHAPETYVFNCGYDVPDPEHPGQMRWREEPPVVKTGLSSARALEEARQILGIKLSPTLGDEVEISLRDRAA